LWKRLSHSNVVPFLGVCDEPAPLSMVSEWMPNGDVRQYVQDYPEADRLQLVCLSAPPCYTTFVLHYVSFLISATGYSFYTLTTLFMVISKEYVSQTFSRLMRHIRVLSILCFCKANVLVNASGKACLGDFGLSSIASFNCTETSAPGPHGTVRWMAPELILLIITVDEKLSCHSTKESDVYAFAMVSIEVLHVLRLNLGKGLTHNFAHFTHRCLPVSSHSIFTSVIRQSFRRSCWANDPSGLPRQKNSDLRMVSGT